MSSLLILIGHRCCSLVAIYASERPADRRLIIAIWIRDFRAVCNRYAPSLVTSGKRLLLRLRVLLLITLTAYTILLQKLTVSPVLLLKLTPCWLLDVGGVHDRDGFAIY